MTRFYRLFQLLISGTTLYSISAQKQPGTGTNPKSGKRNGFCRTNENKSI